MDSKDNREQRHEGEEKGCLEKEKKVTKFGRKRAAERHIKEMSDDYKYQKKKAGWMYEKEGKEGVGKEGSKRRDIE